jgi:beta-xylosidase
LADSLPYEDKIVMDQGNTSVNGPHQGAWVELSSGESWFIHFQDQDAYGRVVHLQPMTWKNAFPVIGIDNDGDGKGEPVIRYKKPNVGRDYPKDTPQTSDEFNASVLGLQWQWNANPQPTWGFPFGNQGVFRLNCMSLPDEYKNFYDVPNLLLQKFSANEFTATTKVNCSLHSYGEKVGLIIMGTNYAYLSLEVRDRKLYVSQSVCLNADRGGEEVEMNIAQIHNKTIYLRAIISREAECTFSYSIDGLKYSVLGGSFKVKPGRWIGAKVGLFSVGTTSANDAGYADFDWFRIEKP